MILGKERGVTIQVKKQGETGTQSLTIHGYSKEEIYNKIYFLFKNLSESNDDITLRFYNTKKRRNDDEQDRSQEETFKSG